MVAGDGTDAQWSTAYPRRTEIAMMADTPFAHAYPHLARWVTTHGWIEIGEDEYRRSFVRVLDSGGLGWGGGEVDTPLDEVLRTVDTALADILRAIGR